MKLRARSISNHTSLRGGKSVRSRLVVPARALRSVLLALLLPLSSPAEAREFGSACDTNWRDLFDFSKPKIGRPIAPPVFYSKPMWIVYLKRKRLPPTYVASYDPETETVHLLWRDDAQEIFCALGHEWAHHLFEELHL